MIGNNKLSTKKNKQNSTINNSLNDLTQSLSGFDMSFGMEPLSGMDTAMKNIRTALVSNNRVLLTNMYTTYSCIQNGIDMPVDDAFRKRPKILAGQIDSNDIDKVYSWMSEKNIMSIFCNAVKWTRLFGGGGIVIDTGEDQFGASKPFNAYNLRIGDDINFMDADLWELAMINVDQYAEEKPYINTIDNETPFNYYGTQLHKTRVLKMLGKRAPSQKNTQLRGWGLSEIEKIIRVLNPLLKYETGVFELIDEVKIDVYKLKNYTDKLMSPGGINKLTMALTAMNRNKNYLNAVTLDTEDDFQQKQMNLSGLADVIREIRVAMASAWKIPVSKLFGQSITGMNGGEDDIENYITMVEGEIRHKYDHILIEMIKIGFQVCCGKIPEEVALEWPPLRVLNAEQEQNIKKSKFDMLLLAKQHDLISTQEWTRQLNIANLFDAEVKEDASLFDENKRIDITETITQTVKSIKPAQQSQDVATNIKPKEQVEKIKPLLENMLPQHTISIKKPFENKGKSLINKIFNFTK